MNLLSVDWDYFFQIPDHDPTFLYDWGHREASLFIDGPLWAIRAGVFAGRGLDLPAVNNHWTGFWGRFRFTEGAQLYFGDSHALAVTDPVIEGISEVWSYDAHHDCGYADDDLVQAINQGRYQCGSWALAYWAQLSEMKRLDDPLPLHVRYPGWKDWRQHEETCLIHDVDRRTDLFGEETPVFDRVFVCRSGAWVPPWCDAQFLDFVGRCPVADRADIGAELGSPVAPRDWEQFRAQVSTDSLSLAGRLAVEGIALTDRSTGNVILTR